MLLYAGQVQSSSVDARLRFDIGSIHQQVGNYLVMSTIACIMQCCPPIQRLGVDLHGDLCLALEYLHQLLQAATLHCIPHFLLDLLNL